MTLDDLAALVRLPAVRQFDADRSVAPETIASLIDVARWTGSARNRQPWRLVDVRSRETIEALARLGAYAHFVACAPSVLVIAAADDGFADTPYDSGRFTQSLILAAAALGIASCPATIYPDANVVQAQRLLGMDPSWRPSHVLALGYPAQRPRVSSSSAIPGKRRDVSDLLITI